MGREKLREDKTCLNCRHVVEKRFCPNCGQENTDTRKTFHHLFVHFFEDLTHYENAFWKTIRNLIFKPSALTKEYLSGKRLSYLAPVRLYIFISFVTFFLIAVLPSSNNTTKVYKQKSSGAPVVTNGSDSIFFGHTKKDRELMKDSLSKFMKNDSIKQPDNFIFGYKSVAELDSLQKFGPEEDRLPDYGYWLVRKVVGVAENNTTEELLYKFKKSFSNNLPKVLFIYMPLFALFLWLFHGKKRWYYFDHGIFTLHYFSFLLLAILLIFLINMVTSYFDVFILNLIFGILEFVIVCWMVYYLFPAHHRFYGESRIISFLKTGALLFINFIFITIIMLAYILYTLINLH